MGGACGTYGLEERCIQVFVGRPDGKRPLGTPKRRWENTIKMDLQEVGWESWTEIIWLRTGKSGGVL